MGFFRAWTRAKNPPQKTGTNQSLQTPISDKLAANVENLQRLFPYTPDLNIRQFDLKTGQHAALAYLDGLNDKVAINNHILRPLMYDIQSLQDVWTYAVPIGRIESASFWSDIERSLFQGRSVLFIEGQLQALSFFTEGWPQRAIKEPQIESTLKGGHQGFVETLDQNIALIRRYIPDRELKMKEYSIGTRAPTRVLLLYLADVIRPEIVQEMEDRIQQVNVDAILNTGELEEYVEDHPYSLFPQFMLTERPDSVASHILQGRLAFVIDHSPSVMIGPMTFSSFFQSVDDYSTRWVVASFLRLLRFFAFFFAVALPAFYIAMISFHYEVIPLDLLISVGESREKVPFPPILEALVMEIAIEMLREAGLRLPSPIGQTTGVVGGIIIGQAAVQAGIVSNIMVIVVALTAISSFIIPSYDMASAIRLVRFPMMIIASLFGMVGISIGIFTIAAHLIAMESLGTPYGSPIAPIQLTDWKDTWVRLPMFKMNKRPRSTDPTQLKRQRSSRKSDDL